jgi:hypothetical protein
MNIDNLNLVETILNVKASGSLTEQIIKDLKLPEGKSIAALLDEQEKNN